MSVYKSASDYIAPLFFDIHTIIKTQNTFDDVFPGKYSKTYSHESECRGSYTSGYNTTSATGKVDQRSDLSSRRLHDVG